MVGELKQFEPIFGSWYEDGFIGEGNFGKVYKIKRDILGKAQYSALKLIKVPKNDSELRQAYNDGMDEVSITSYFESIVKDVVDEILMMVRFKGNTNIVSYEDHQIIPNENGIGATIFIRMELLSSLENAVNAKRLSNEDVVRLGIDICTALDKCHSNNVIHRDIKPGNIFSNDDGDFKLGDFGIARHLEKTMSGLSIKGTYTYMAPEVYFGKEYNSTVDIYSLGIVMFRLLNNNRTPFLPPYPAPITFSIKNDAQNRRMGGEAFQAPAGADSGLSEIVLKACAHSPNDRFANALQMKEALSAYAAQINENSEQGSYEMKIDADEPDSDMTKTVGFEGNGFSDEETESNFNSQVGNEGLVSPVEAHDRRMGVTQFIK